MLKILVVCTGNICRSPVAEQLLRSQLDEKHYRVESAGTAALVGHGLDSVSAKQMLRKTGLQPTVHIARQVSAELMDSADLILTMTREQRTFLISELPAAMNKTYTLREFARLATIIQSGIMNSDLNSKQVTFQKLKVARGQLLKVHDPIQDDIIDPYGRSEEVAEWVISEVFAAVLVTAKFIRENFS